MRGLDTSNALILMNVLRQILARPTRYALIHPPAMNANAELVWNMITKMRKVLKRIELIQSFMVPRGLNGTN